VQFDSKYFISNANSNNGNHDGEDPAWDAVWKSSACITPDMPTTHTTRHPAPLVAGAWILNTASMKQSAQQFLHLTDQHQRDALRSGLDANVTGFLFNLKNKAQSYALNGKAVMNHRIGAESTESGYTLALSASKTSGNFLWGSDFNLESDRYNPNYLGILFSPNGVSHSAWINYHYYKPWWKLNNYWSSLWVFNESLYKPWAAWAITHFGVNFGGNEQLWNNLGGLWSSEIYEQVVGAEQLPDHPVVMGRRHIMGSNNNLNASYSFNNNMNIQLYARHYWQKAEYSAFYGLDEQGELTASPYTGLSASGEPLNNVAANYFNIDLVYTWRFAPGSDLLMVYKNGMGHYDSGHAVDRGYGYNAGHLMDYSGTNNFSSKLLYYLDYEQVKRL